MIADPPLWISILALVIALYAAVHARRSADASSRSADSAERALERSDQQEREEWIERLLEALPGNHQVAAIIADMPERLKPEWEALLRSAAARNPKTPSAKFDALWKQFAKQWEEASTTKSPSNS